MARRTLRALEARIKRKTIEEAFKNGFKRISTKDIAEVLSITEPTIYVHFKSKGELLFESYLYAKDIVEKEERALLEEYLKSEKRESDKKKLLSELSLMEKVSDDNLLYKLNYESGHRDEKSALHREIHRALGGNEGKESVFLFCLPLLQEKGRDAKIGEEALSLLYMCL